MCQYFSKKLKGPGASLVAQSYGIHLPVQETRVQSPTRDDPTCWGAPTYRDSWACALEPGSRNSCSPRALQPARPAACAPWSLCPQPEEPQQGAGCGLTCDWRQPPHSPHLEEGPQEQRPSTAKNKHINKNDLSFKTTKRKKIKKHTKKEKKRGKHYCMLHQCKKKRENNQEPLWEMGNGATDLPQQLEVEANTSLHKPASIWF